ncbi:putative metal-binding motif-containing protein [Myxococcus stipitatus]|uniref:hypothetical protein n=1 Tax=Myxococcus stipitatus TaxID=83455 RepID=UPI0031454EF9
MRDLRVRLGVLLLVALTACQSKEVMEELPRGDLTGQEDGGTHGDGGPGDDGGLRDDGGGAGYDAGEYCDGGGIPWDAGIPEDGGNAEDGGPSPWDAGPGPDDAGTVEDGGVSPLACEKTQGICAGAKRAWVDGAFETVCTARSYGADYEESESRCDGLDNDCDGATDPSVVSPVSTMATAFTAGVPSLLKTNQGVFVSVGDSTSEARILRLGMDLSVLGTSSVPMPWMRPGGVGTGSLRWAFLVRTQAGFALVHIVEVGNQHQGYLVPLDDMGAPIPAPGGGLVEQPLFSLDTNTGSFRVATSPTGDRLVVLWTTNRWQPELGQLVAMVAKVQGPVVTAPKAVFASSSGYAALPGSILWLRNGELLFSWKEEKPWSGGSIVRVRRFDVNLDPLGVERSIDMPNEPVPLLVDLGAQRGGPVESPVLVLRGSTSREVYVVSDLFNGGMPVTWADSPEGHVIWYGALADEGVLRLSWIATFKDHEMPPPGGDTWLGWNGRLWTQDEGHAAEDRTPGPGYLPLHRYGTWVVMEKLEPKRVGALYMTTTPEEGSVLNGLRYCVP